MTVKEINENAGVDIIGLAYDYALKDQSAQAAALKNVIKVVAPAKVNLVLDVGAVRADGYHEVKTIMHTLMLHDVLYIKRTPYKSKFEGPLREVDRAAGCETTHEPVQMQCGGEESGCAPTQNLHVKTIMIGCDGIEVPKVENEENLVTRAVKLLAQKVEYAPSAPECIEIRVEKHIPAQAGLGGGSADAVAALVGAAKLMGIEPDSAALERCAKKLGSDVAFFLRGGCAQYANKGDEFVRALEPAKKNVLLVKPAGGLSTAKVYAAFDELGEGGNSSAKPQNDAVVQARATSQSAAPTRPQELQTAAEISLYNNLTRAAEKLLPEIKTLREWLEAQSGTQGTILCGSGSCVCAICDSFEAAMSLAAAPELQNCWKRTTALANLRAAVVPA